jgi:hypothetical protein
MSKVHQVYFLRRADGLIKIGTTKTLETRLAALSKSHGPLEIVRLINGDRAVEQSLHRKFRAFHEFGEWFRDDGGELTIHIGQLPDGDTLSADGDTAAKAWAAGEAAFMDAVRTKVAALIKVRMDRLLVKRAEAMTGLAADYGFPTWFIEHIRNGKARTVSAFAYQRLRETHLTEMALAVEQLHGEIASEGGKAEARALAAKIAARRAGCAAR